MIRILNISSKCALGCGLALAMLFPLESAWAKNVKDKVLHSFEGGNDGASPEAGLIADKSGNLYGTTVFGGVNNAGTVFKVTPNGTESVLYAFTGGSDGATPAAGLILDSAGNLYGTTGGGGADGYGTVFELTPNGTETVLYAFTGGSDGTNPLAGLIADKSGNVYGTTPFGGDHGNGTVFKLAQNGTETVLHAFTGGRDGAGPVAGLIADKNGNLYGTTHGGGSYGYGNVFEIAPNGTETVLHSFTGGRDGRYPTGGLIADNKGNLYGTTLVGGLNDVGTVFKVAPDSTETVLYTFTSGSDGALPEAGLIADKMGNLYGTTTTGGAHGGGTVFKLAPDGTETVLYAFAGGSDGRNPIGTLIADKKGNLYGTTKFAGAHNNGTVFKIKD